jgi:hypothetical protein
MTISVTITKPGVTDQYGRPMLVGTTYAVDDAFGLSLISQLKATDTGNSLVQPGITLDEPLNVQYVNAAAIAAPTAQMLASYSTVFTLDVSPFTRYRTNGTVLVPMAEYVLDASDNITGLVGAGENLPVKELRTSMARNRIVKRGSDLINTTISTGWTRSGAGNVFRASSLYSRRSSHTMEIDMTSASADATLEWSNATGVAADPTDQLLSFDVYIPEIVQANVGGAVGINIFVSNATTYAAPGTLWVVNSNYLRQGWNQITLCGLDADGVLDGDRGTGTLPYGMSKAGASSGASPLNWSNPIKFIQIVFIRSSVNLRKFYLDSQIRIPAKIKPFVCVGFDSSGSSLTDDEFTDNTAPFMQSLGIPSYFTMTQVYDAIYMGTQDDTRRQSLYGTYKWDAINHSWSHGASVPGVLYASGNSLVVSGTGTLATLTVSSAHGWTIGTRVLIAVFGATGASSTNANGVFDALVTTTTAVTYVIAGGTDGTATGTVKASTYLNDVFNTVAVTNQPIILGASNALAELKHEFVDINYYGRMKGWLRGSRFMAYPNNSYPDMRIMETVAELAGIKLARGLAGSTVRVGEFGVDNPLALGSVELNSGSTGSTYANIVDAVQGAINRGQGICIFGHYLRNEALDAVVDPDSPPGKNGNPAAPGPSTGLWWYRVTFRKLMTYLAARQAAGELDFVSADDLVNQLAD